MNANENKNPKSKKIKQNQRTAKPSEVPEGMTAEDYALGCRMVAIVRRARKLGRIKAEKDGNEFRADLRYMIDLVGRRCPGWRWN